MTAVYDRLRAGASAPCPWCEQLLGQGEPLYRSPSGQWWHLRCAAAHQRATEADR